MANSLIVKVQEVCELIIDHFKKINSDIFLNIENIGPLKLRKR